MGKIIKKIKNRAGLTLTEMLVTVAILSLFSAAVLTGMTTALSVRRDNIMANDAEIIASMVTNFITNELRTASPVEGEAITVGSAGEYVTYQSNESNYRKVTLKLNDEGQLIMVLYGLDDSKDDDDKEVPVFSEAAYSDNSVKRLKIIGLKFVKTGKTIDVSFDVGYDNVDISGDPVKIATAETHFTVGLMNSE